MNVNCTHVWHVSDLGWAQDGFSKPASCCKRQVMWDRESIMGPRAEQISPEFVFQKSQAIASDFCGIHTHKGELRSTWAPLYQFYFLNNGFFCDNFTKNIKKSLLNHRKSWSEARNHSWVWKKRIFFLIDTVLSLIEAPGAKTIEGASILCHLCVIGGAYSVLLTHDNLWQPTPVELAVVVANVILALLFCGGATIFWQLAHPFGGASIREGTSNRDITVYNTSTDLDSIFGVVMFIRVPLQGQLFVTGANRGLISTWGNRKVWQDYSPGCDSNVYFSSTTLVARFMGQHGAHLGPIGPRWAPCWPHELCYLGQYSVTFLLPRDHVEYFWKI